MHRVWTCLVAHGRYAVLSLLLGFPVFSAAPVDFFGIRSGTDYEKADRELIRRLRSGAGVEFDTPEWLTYGEAIRKAVDWRPKDGPYLARMTPYAYVAAEMLGANFEPLAVYRSAATQKTTYHTYFVVSRKAFPGKAPRLEDIHDWIRQDSRRFIYHDKFSTSSYFLPSLYFRSQRIFSMDSPGDGMTRMTVVQEVNRTSAYLVEQVAAEKADLAAVWDDKKTFFEQPQQSEVGNKVWFVELPTLLPNDFLVCSSSLDAETQKRVREAVRKMASDKSQIGAGDFMWWEDLEESDAASDARGALAALRRAAAAPPAPVTIEVKAAPGQTVDPKYLESARQAIRLAGTEFRIYDPDYYGHVDVVWTLRRIHDGAIQLESDIKGSGLEPQTFQISFDFDHVEQDLSKRIGALLHSRMHRIRYVWPYEEQDPTVIRDVDFSLPENSAVRVQRISWRNPEKNVFDSSKFQDAKVAYCDFHIFRLKDGPFPKSQDLTSYAFDPMSNQAYQVILVRPSSQRPIFRILTAGFLFLLMASGVGAVIDLRRKSQPERAPQPPPSGLFDKFCQELVDEHHSTWRGRRMAFVNVLWCDRSRVEECIEELKVGGLKPEFDAVRRHERRWGLLMKIPVLSGMLEGSVGRESTRQLNVDPSKVSDAARLANLVPFLVESRSVSSFVGEPVEWHAMNRMAGAILGTTDGAGGAQAEAAPVRPDDAAVLRMVSNHFAKVLDDSLQQVSLFRRSWLAMEFGGRYLLSAKVALCADIKLGGEAISGLVVDFNLPPAHDGTPTVQGQSIDAWLLGRIRQKAVIDQEGRRVLHIHFRTMAVLGG
jgi:ABC-type phosphate/phosphonate transport system substrate-binding protein